ncbi:SUKH-3 domain-containing protein [Actinoplanes sp. NPDC051633]|uniref:SUKH-3 domain-containing protein n=1 Tax=Actinoplanes sp. NPDC051633 TaxID=3155670 RepID=UPI0034489767
MTPIPGDGGRTLIDRATGLLTTWPSVPVETVAELYRERQPALIAQRRTVDPSVELLRNARRRPAPTTAVHLTVDGRLFRARGAKGDQEIGHHPLVVQHLNNVDPRERVRGCERHAELIALSDALHIHGDSLTLGDARDLLRTSEFEAFYVREPGDPQAGQPVDRPCESCVRALVDFAVLPWPELGRIQPITPFTPDVGVPAELDRFSEPITQKLFRGGWHDMDRVAREALAELCVEELEAFGHSTFPAVEQMLLDFPTLIASERGPGIRRAVRWIELVPMQAAHTLRALGDLAEVLGVPLCPIGVEHFGDTVLAMDERGRVFALDQAGEWFVGETFDEALAGLLTGDGPAARLRDDGSW